jgi:hypothetical protein
MWRLIKFFFWLALLAAIALAAYAYLGPILLPDHFVPPVTEITAPVELDLD